MCGASGLGVRSSRTRQHPILAVVSCRLCRFLDGGEAILPPWHSVKRQGLRDVNRDPVPFRVSEEPVTMRRQSHGFTKKDRLRFIQRTVR